MKAIIFGVNGQDGFYLNQLLTKLAVEVIGVSTKENKWIKGDVSVRKFVSELVKTHQPHFIFHLAANSTTRHDALWDNHRAISTGSLNILEAVKKYTPACKVFLSGSGLQFKNEGLPISAAAPFVASSPYVVSRNHSVYAARYYRSLGIEVYVGYFFNHDSPRRPQRHVAQKIISYCKSIKRQTTALAIGNIKVKKEWTFAGDVVEAIWTLVNQDKIFECVIGSGLAYSIEEWLAICFEAIGKDWHHHVVIKDGFIPAYTNLVSDPSVIKSLGWKPKVTIQELSKMMLWSK